MVNISESVFCEDFLPFDEAHANRSSDVYLSSDSRVVVKSRPGQGEEKFMREFLSLSMWNQLLNHYNRSQDGSYTIHSPKPIAVDLEGKNLYMSFVPGETILRAYTMTQTEVGGLAVKDLIMDSAYRLGRLFSIKNHEQLVHGDFDPRHLLVGKSAVLSVIDVESSFLGESEVVSRENEMLHKKLSASVPSWKLSLFQDGFNEGRANFEAQQKSIAKDVLASVNLGEKPDFNIALFEGKSRS